MLPVYLQEGGPEITLDRLTDQGLIGSSHYQKCIINKPWVLLQWLSDVFLPYLDEWEMCVNDKEGFSKSRKEHIA